MSLIDLTSLNDDEFNSFLDSFDNVLCDCDGVIWHAGVLIPGANQSLSKLKELGKNVHFVTNNSYLGIEKLCTHLQQLNIQAKPSDVANPCLAIINYFKKIDYKGSVCVIGSTYFKEDIKKAGFNVVDLEVPTLKDENIKNVPEVLKDCIKQSSGIGAIICDIDLSMSYAKLTTLLVCLQNPNVLFLTACADKVFPITPKMNGIGPDYYIKPLETLTGRKPVHFGKPGMRLKELLVDKFNITDPSRTLFIGDSLECDIEFAAKAGYKTLLVLTGSTKLSDVQNCKNQESIPNFFLQSLGNLHELIKN